MNIFMLFVIPEILALTNPGQRDFVPCFLPEVLEFQPLCAGL